MSYPLEIFTRMSLASLVIDVLKVLSIVIPLLVSVAYLTIAERKIMASIQRRRGPNVVGFVGLLQPLADGLKLFIKETILPSSSTTILFLLAPIISFILSLVAWAVIPFSQGLVLCDLNFGVLYLFAVSSLNVYGLLLAGWSSNSKYAFLGSIRSAAQLISYEISLGLSVLSVIICSGSFNLTTIVNAQEKVWFIIPLFPMFIIFYVSMLAETNRAPFDLAEAESELVSGYNVEYSAMAFALFFLSEYGNMLLMSSFAALLFLGGWHPFIWFIEFQSFWFGIKVVLGAVFFIVSRAILPRFRYDQLMSLGWKCFLPASLSFFIFSTCVLLSFNWLPT